MDDVNYWRKQAELWKRAAKCWRSVAYGGGLVQPEEARDAYNAAEDHERR